MVTIEKIPEAKAKIEMLFIDQCENGKQSKEKNLNNDGGAACGQFIGKDAQQKPQRGLHGSAAALRVLAQAQSEKAPSLVARLVYYLINREKIYSQDKEPGFYDSKSFQNDQQNIIELCEVLYALKFVATSDAATDEYTRKLAQMILASKVQDKGWSFFLGEDSLPKMLPTAYAIFALSNHGYKKETANQVEWLEGEMFRESERANTSILEEIHDDSIKIFCIFALVFRSEEIPESDRLKLKSAFDLQWKKHKSLLFEDLEQNIEYWNFPIGSSHYVRVPWQLYLLALAARLEPRKFWSFEGQWRLTKILEAVLSEHGFRYPHSGITLSSRTNGILYDVLVKINQHAKSHWGYKFLHLIGRVELFFKNRWVLLVIFAILVALCIVCTVLWFKIDTNFEDIGSGVVVGVIIAAVASLYSRLRKP